MKIRIRQRKKRPSGPRGRNVKYFGRSIEERDANGEWLKTDDVIQVKNPADKSLVGEVYTVGTDETKNAISAAKAAFPQWSALTGEERESYLQKVVDKLKEKRNI